MKQEEKDLLLKDLCARLPYGVKCCIKDSQKISGYLVGIIGEIVSLFGSNRATFNISIIKPYLFPLSSMTEEQKYSCPIGYANIETFIEKTDWTLIEIEPNLIIHFIDWLNKNHFDYRGLIPMNLANDATGLNIY